jgi:hypothetical protein
MKVLIKENKLQDAIYKFIGVEIDLDNLNWSSPYDYDPQSGEEGEVEGLIEFYYGDYDSEYGDFVFDYFSPEYYNDNSSEFLKEKSPILEIRDRGLHENLLSVFGDDLWRVPLKLWFEDTFNLPVNTITHHYD